MHILLVIIYILSLINIGYTGQLFNINLESINDVYHRAAIMTLLKSRAKVLLNETCITLSDRVLYEQCANNAKNPVQLARCVVPLLNLYKNPSILQQNDLSPMEKFIDLFKKARDYFAKTMPDPIKNIVPVKSIISDHNRYRTTDVKTIPWKQPVPVKEFYTTNRVIPESYEFKSHPINIKEIKDDYYGEDAQDSNKYYDVNWRQKREINRRNEFESLTNLEKIENYYKQQQYVQQFIKKVNDENSHFINSASKIPMKFSLKKNNNMTIIENVFSAINSITGKGNGEFSFISPKLLSILPSSEKGRKHLLSPTLFSFHEKDGLFPLPNILKNFNINENTKKDLMEILLRVSGATKALDDVMQKLEPEMKEMNEKVYPAIKDLEQIEKNWNSVRQSYSSEQLTDIDKHGYAFLEPEQIQLLYNNYHGRNLKLNLEEYRQLNKKDREKRIDEDIRKLSKLDEAKIFKKVIKMKRRKRQVVHGNGEITTNQAGGHTDYSQEAPGTHGPIHIITMEPWAFGSRIGEGVALEAVSLSPYAFFTELMMPEALVVQTLGPRAFVPAILSPSALIARILSPAAFRAEVLSPRALQAWILTPEAFIAEVLSPKMLEVRVLSPEAMIIQVLSPSFIAPRVLSPEAGAIAILSPSILSPRVLSGHALTVEVLSPHILGGGHSSHEDHEQGKEHHHMEDEHTDIHDVARPRTQQQPAPQQNRPQTQTPQFIQNNNVQGFIPQQSAQFGQANIQEQPINLGTGEVREVDLGQINFRDNNINSPFRIFI